MKMDYDSIETVVFMYSWLITLTSGYAHWRRQKRRLRRWFVRPLLKARQSQGHYDNLFKFIKAHDPDQFFIYTRMTVPQFDRLFSLLKPYLLKRSHRKPIGPEQRLAMTLKYLALGGSMQSLAWEFYVGKSTASAIVKDTCDAIWQVLGPLYLQQPTYQEWTEIEEGFNSRWNMPNCIGAIDGKHISIQAPANSGSKFYNYKKDFSIVLLAACDWNYCFTLIDIGAYGSQSDGGIFKESAFGQGVENETLNMPLNKPLPGTDISFPHYFVGDEAFPLRSRIMRPFPGRVGPLPEQKKIFNYRLSRARRVIENAFGILVARWQIFKSKIVADPENVDKFVKATISLHNYLKKDELSMPYGRRHYCPDSFIDQYQRNGEILQGQWRQEANAGGNGLMNDICRMGTNYSPREVVALRDCLAEYFMTDEGEVHWQYDMVNSGVAPA